MVELVMSEKIFNEQTNYGWGLTFNLTGKAPAVAKRIWDTYSDAFEYANNFNDSAVEGLLLSVVADEDEKKNGVYFVQRIKKNAEDDDAILIKVGSGDIDAFVDTFNKEIESLKTADTNNRTKLELDIEKVSDDLVTAKTEIDTVIGTISEGNTIAGMIEDVNRLIGENKDIVDAYTINNKTISTNPVLNSDDLLVSKDYTVLGQNAENVFPGDIITTAIGKIEVMLANTTLALTAAINDLEMRIGKPSEYDEETGDVISEATGLYKKYEEIEGKLNSVIE